MPHTLTPQEVIQLKERMEKGKEPLKPDRFFLLKDGKVIEEAVTLPER
jgi:hypothetical protein